MTYFGRSPMKITYHTGPNRNRYCKIKVNRGDFNYDIDGIVKGSRDTPERRRDLFLQIVARNQGILHTHLIKIAYELSHLAKRTIENELERMENEKIFESDKEGEQANSLRRWFIKSSESRLEKAAKKEVREIIKLVEDYVSKIAKSYSKFNPARKAWAMTYLLEALHNFQPTIEVINQEFRIKKEKRQFDSIFRRAYNILKYEERDYVDGRPLLRRLLQLKSSNPYVEMNNFLEEIRK